MAEGADMAGRLEAGGISPLPQRERHGLSKTAKIVGSAILGGSAIFGSAFGINRLRQADETPVVPPVATAPAAVIPTEGPQLATPMPSPTPEVTQAPAVNPDAKFPPPTPETQVEIPCQILPTEFCSQAELLEWTDNRGVWTALALNLPKGTPLSSPLKGQVGKAQFVQPAAFEGLGATISDPDNLQQGTISLIGDITFDNDNMDTINVNPGDLVGRIGDSGSTNYDATLLISAKKDSPGHELLRNLFPKAFEKPARRVENTAPSNANAVIGSPIYSDNPPR